MRFPVLKMLFRPRSVSRSSRSLLPTILLAVVATLFGAGWMVPAAASGVPRAMIRPAASAPGNPGTPSNPQSLFTEDFEHGVSATPSLLGDYVGANGFTYTADPYYLNDADCNGVIFSKGADNPAATQCSPNATYYNWSRAFAQALGQVQTPANPDGNHALLDFTTAGTSAAGMVALQTQNTASMDVQNRFLSFSIDVAEAYCNQPAGRAKLNFYLLDGTTAHPAQSAPVVPCTDPTMQPVTVTGPSDGTTRGFSVGTVHASGSVLYTGTDFGFRVVNDVAVSGGGGNDVAFDNLRVLDVTPQLDKSFEQGQPAGFPSTMTFTITNTSELGSKDGWSFAENLPAGVSIATVPNFTTTCTNGAISSGGAAGASSVAFTGDLGQGQESCTITIDVVTDPTTQPGTVITSEPADSTDLAGLEQPGKATMTVGDRSLPQVDCLPAESRATQRWWYFGTGAGLDFGTSGHAVPTALATTGQTSAEGTTVVTDVNGALQFWSNGTAIFDKHHNVMPNGGGLTGNVSATQTVAAFPSLTQDGVYFVVTTSGSEQNNGQLRYSVVDMALNGGLGDVTATKDVDLGPAGTAAEGLTAIPNADGTGFWVISSQNSSPNVRAYLFDGDGPADPDGAGPLNAGDPVISVMPTPNFNQYSSFNLSPDLSTVVMTTNPQGGSPNSASRIRLLDFDAATGRFAQRMEWSAAQGGSAGNALYTADFSPSGEYVYASKIFGSSDLWRYRIAGAADGAAVKATEERVGGLTGSGGQVRRGPDGRMYAAGSGSSAISVVNEPDEADIADVDFVSGGVALAAGTSSRFGLPQMVTGCPRTAGLEMTKTAAITTDHGTTGKADEGDVITYTFTVHNSGRLAASDVSVEDLMPGLSAISPASVANLAAGDDATFTATYTVTQADVDDGGDIVNVASATGTDPDGDELVSPPGPTSTAQVPTADPAPGLSIDKTATLSTDNGTAGKADEGDVITYSFKVTNTGNVTMKDIAVEDALPGLSPTVPLQVATLAPGTETTFTATYTVTQADVDAGGSVHNSATAKGDAPDGTSTQSTPDTTDTAIVTAAPGLKVEKSAVVDDANHNGAADKGETIDYSFQVTNTGNVTMTDVTVADGLTGLSAINPANVASLAPGDDTVFTASYVVTQADVDAGGSVHNSATAKGDAPDGTSTESAPDTTDTNVVPGAPSIVLDKSSKLDDTNGNGKADVGETIDYTFEVTNTGNVTATNVTVTDPKVTGLVPASATIAPGDTKVFTADPYTVTQDDVDDGVVHNAATATATVPGGATVTSDDVEDVDTVDAHPDLSVVKTAELSVDNRTADKADADDVIAYTFTVHNSGGATAFDVSVHDALPGLSSVSPSSVARLAPGADAVFVATYRVTRADVAAGGVHNTASVSYRGPTRGGVVPAPVTARSNSVAVAAARLGTPRIATKASSAKVTMNVGKAGRPKAVRLHDTVTISGLATGGAAHGTATLYGPTAKRTARMCTPGNKVATVSFTPRNGTIRTASVSVSRPGRYTWVASISADKFNEAASHRCGLSSETTLVHRVKIGRIHIETGYAGVAPSAFFARLARAVNPARVSIPAIGMRAPLDVVGLRKASMTIPDDVKRGGWLKASAAPGEVIGSAVIAGHVSDRHDRPGAFGRLSRAKIGQVVKVRGADGKVQRYRIAKVHSQKRAKGFAGGLVSTTGRARLTLVTCTGKITYPNGHFHYTKNLVVVAYPIR